ncbi:MAG: hypothetical protein DRP12_03830 [Candidatus Aenigmatarchaeota archaeon]|nr:MAG: hypothetical protein DRP12_03830 [Candidatus Aenigmarchaeota archaeon]
MRPYVLLLILVLLSGCFTAKILQPKEVRITEVIDGDTVLAETGERIRLLGINAPEKGQKFWNLCRKMLKGLLLNRTVRLEADEEDRDRWGRLLRWVWLEGKLVNEELVRQGCAFPYIIPPNQKYAERIEKAWQECLQSRKNLCNLSKGSCSHCIFILDFHWNAEGDDCKNPNGEWVVFGNLCPFPCNLTGWEVSDEANHRFIFPAATLQPGENLTLFSGSGENKAGKLYWNRKGRCRAVWNNEGDTLFLWDSERRLVLNVSYNS